MEIMMYVLMFAAFFICAAVFGICSRKKKAEMFRERAEQAFGRIPDGIPELDSIECYFENLPHDENAADKLTWNDLEMDGIFARADSCITSAGEEMLYAQMHLCRKDHAEKIAEISALPDSKDMRLKIYSALINAGIVNYNGAAKIAAGHIPVVEDNLTLYRIMPIATACGIILLPFFPAAGVIVIIAAVIANMALYYKAHRKFCELFGTIAYLSGLVRTGKALADIPEIGRIFPELKKAAEEMKPVCKAARLIAPPGGSEAGDALSEFVKIFTQSEMLSCAKVISLLNKSNCLNVIYEAVGLCDSACAVYNLKATLPVVCAPEFTEENALDVRGLYHPLIRNAVPNTVKIGEDTLITGSNASGKSSFIKALAVNCILAQSIGICTAESFSMRRGTVMTSMAVNDSTIDGDSYFIAELKSLRRLTSSPEDSICFIDEILKGTNTIAPPINY